MRLDALKLAVDYHASLPAATQNNANLVIDTAELFMVFLNQDDKKLDNPKSGSKDVSPKPESWKSGAIPKSGSR